MKKMPKFKNHFNRSDFPVKGEVNNLPSETIPDQTMTVREIFHRYAKGLPIVGQKVPIYEGEDDPMEGVDLRSLDLSERHDMLKETKSAVKELQEKLNRNSKVLEKIPTEGDQGSNSEAPAERPA